MRILSIRGAGLASLVSPFEISLQLPPLSHFGLIAIAGPTGAGKSTLLDALCLALFDRLPRLDSLSHVPQQGEELKPNDPRTILSRGQAEGWAEVDFAGSDNVQYRARWSVRRARGLSTGRFQASKLVLRQLDTEEPIGRTKTETLTAIEEKLGLSYEQFRRSVFLAQGDFAAFLRADPKERSELLERMTGTKIYSRLSILAHERASLAQQELSLLDQQRNALSLLSDEEKQQLQQAQKEQQEALSAKQELCNQSQIALKQAQQHVQFAQTVSLYQEQLDQWKSQESERKARQEFIKQWTVAKQVEEPYRGLTETRTKLKQAKQAQKELQKRHSDASQQLAQLHQELQEAERTQKELLSDDKRELEEAQRLDTQVSSVDQELRSQQDAEQSTAKRLKELQSHTEARCTEIETLSHKQRLHKLLTVAKQQQQLRDNEKALKQKRLSIQEQQQKMFAQRDLAVAELATVQARLQSEEEQLLRQQVTSLQANLETTDTCPVCGSASEHWNVPYHPHQGKSHVPSSRLDELRHAFTEWTQKIAAANEKLPHLDQQLEDVDKQLREISVSLQAIRNEWQKDLEELPKNTENVEAVGEEVLTAKREHLAVLKAQSVEVEQQHKGYHQQVQASLSKKRELLQNRSALLGGQTVECYRKQKELEFSTNVKRLDTLRQAIQEAHNTCISTERDLALLTQRLDEWKQAEQSFMKRLQQHDVDQLEKLLQIPKTAIEKEEKLLRAAEREGLAVTEKLRAAKETLEKWAAEHPQEEVAEVHTRIATLRKEIEQASHKLQAIQVRLLSDESSRKQHTALQKKIAEKREGCTTWLQLKELIGSADGKKFRLFAQSLTFDVLLRSANQHLSDLAPRYRLQRAPRTHMELQVVDCELANEVRSVHSLSGGETFLVSLAMALGLASLSAETTPIYSLFIDEGFGALDDQSLEMALGALDDLQASGRQVVVISHLRTLIERIGARIQVTPSGGACSTVEVV